MAKSVPLPTRSFGAEPGIPEIDALAAWVADHRGKTADLMAYQLDVSLAPQLAAGITAPCAGGLFCREHVVGNLAGLSGNRDRAIGEIDVEGLDLIDDAKMLAAQKKNVWCALPAPSKLGIADAYYHDEDEWGEALAAAYRKAMRNMRDAGIGGHILIGDRAVPIEVAALARKNVVFFVPDATGDDMETLMEYQREIAARSSLLAVVFDLAEGYGIPRLVIMDPDREAVKTALQHLDPDQIVCGGYCKHSCEEYWQNLAASAIYRK